MTIIDPFLDVPTKNDSTQRPNRKSCWRSRSDVPVLCGTIRWPIAPGRISRGESVSHSAAEKRLVALKADYPWLKDVSSVILQQTLRDQKAAFDNFFNPRLKALYPRFKRKDSRQAIRLTKAAFRYRDGEITIAKATAPLPIRWSRPLPSAPSSITLSRDHAGRYFISCLCEL